MTKMLEVQLAALEGQYRLDQTGSQPLLETLSRASALVDAIDRHRSTLCGATENAGKIG